MNKKVLKAFLIVALFMPMTNVLAYSKFNCGTTTEIPVKIADIVRMIVLIIEIATPVILVVVGSIDLIKAMTAGKDDEMSKAQGLFVKRLITGVLVFFVVAGVKLVLSLVSDDTNVITCIDYFVNGVPSGEKY